MDFQEEYQGGTGRELDFRLEYQGGTSRILDFSAWYDLYGGRSECVASVLWLVVSVFSLRLVVRLRFFRRSRWYA